MTSSREAGNGRYQAGEYNLKGVFQELPGRHHRLEVSDKPLILNSIL